MRFLRFVVAATCFVSVCGITFSSGNAGKVILPGMQEDGRVLLPDGWTLDPVGQQIGLGDFPVNLALHPDGRHVAALHSGWGKHEVRMLDLETGEMVSQADIPESYYGLEFSPDGSMLYASGAGDETIHAFAVNSGVIQHEAAYQVRPASEKGVVAGLRDDAFGAAESMQMDLLTTDDVADDIRLNEIIWKSIRGADSPMPRPVRAAFFLGLSGEEGEQ
ncbi:MAG: hypothetical protein HOE48_02150 [Candidatus Latescibacteria bacterium]|jgi:hypothetical protein|nr:hypothetical protein [Candidatus Latescibacterota bacterium]MBT4136682.1 hypothetical protein [Candidatus Latescibacterota bacterium]MBT5832208.1 hypothetical protein [Candidatus Latescibacterota bacterium]